MNFRVLGRMNRSWISLLLLLSACEVFSPHPPTLSEVSQGNILDWLTAKYGTRVFYCLGAYKDALPVQGDYSPDGLLRGATALANERAVEANLCRGNPITVVPERFIINERGWSTLYFFCAGKSGKGVTH
jgi:hypothetical protein